MNAISRVLSILLFTTALALGTGCGGEEEATDDESTEAEGDEAADDEAAGDEEAAGGVEGCAQTATESQEVCNECCVAAGAAGNSWSGGDEPTCRCIGG